MGANTVNVASSLQGELWNDMRAAFDQDSVTLKFLTMALGAALGLMVPIGLILACSLILDRPVTILVVGIIVGISATYALSVVLVRPSKHDEADKVGAASPVPLATICVATALIVCGLSTYVSDRPHYLFYRDMPHIAAAMLFLPGMLVGCGCILYLIAGRAASR